MGALLSLSCVGGGPPGQAEMVAGLQAFCFRAALFCAVLSVVLIVARNSRFREVQTCHLFLVEAGRVLQAMLKFQALL